MLRQRYWSPAELKSFVGDLSARDPELVDSIRREKPEDKAGMDPAAESLFRFVGGPEAAAGGEDVSNESIILTKGRPVLPIVRDNVELKIIDDPAADVIKRRLQDARPRLLPAIPAIGRIELSNNPEFEWVGTGWLVADGMLVTNRHVAEIFAMGAGARFVFRPGADPSRPQTARIDFLEEIGREDAIEVGISGILWVSPPSGPDVAFLKLGTGLPGRVRPIELESSLPAANTQVCVIGYPARDSRVPDSDLMDRLYGNVYDRKRLAPGQIVDASDAVVRHDCTTLGGNSGSSVLSLATGRALALHYSGTYLRANYAVPAAVLSRLLRDRPWQGAASGGRPLHDTPLAPSADPRAVDQAAATPKGGAGLAGVTVDPTGGGLRLTVPLTIDLRLGLPLDAGMAASAATSAPAPAADPRPQPKDSLAAAVDALRNRLVGSGEAVSVREGYVFRDGWITDEKAVVVRVRPGGAPSREALGLSADTIGYPVEIREADPTELVRTEHGMADEAPHAYVSNYRRTLAGKFDLDPIEEDVTLLCHASPDAGWPSLRGYLDGVGRDFVLGMYDLSAPHIVDRLEHALRGSGTRRKSFKLVLDPKESLGGGTKKDDLPERDVIERMSKVQALKFQAAFAPTSGPRRLFDSAYHIKVGVSDDKVWLSSGNWQSSNQPDLAELAGSNDAGPLRTYNREWHVIATSKPLASVFKAHLEQDLDDAESVPEAPDLTTYPDVLVPESYLEVPNEELPTRARYFKPLPVQGRIRIQPLLTPDNYGKPVVELIESAQKQILFQNQSFKPGLNGGHGEDLDDLLQALLRKQQDGLDVRIIFRKIGDVAGTLERIKDYGFDTDRTKLRVQTNCHTKGIVVDKSSVLVGSHNWTTAGTRYNRDASLIIEDSRVAGYFAELFEFDWQRLSRSRAETDPSEKRATSELLFVDPNSEAPVPRGYVRMKWFDWNGE